MTDATLTVLPWVRQGVASAIRAPDSLGLPPPPTPTPTTPLAARASIAAAVQLNGQAVQAAAATLFGPADVASIDAGQIIRTEPVPGTADFEPNYFALVEFDRPDFPWLFTPLSADGQSRLRPWLCLVVVKQQAGVSLGSPAGSPLPVLEIAAPAQPVQELPPLADCWGWAHAQAVPADASAAALADAISHQPERSLSRLVCPRVLEPGTDYLACVVPTFELGRRAGLGLAVADAELNGPGALSPAWPAEPSDEPGVRLPVYHHWAFRTGSGGDFETLARRLRPLVDETLGQRTLNISQPGFDAGSATSTQMQGALLPLATPYDADAAPVPAAFKAALAAIVNAPGRGHATPAPADVALAPPLYGAGYAGRTTVDPAGTGWVDQLNVDPRWRVTAALGTQVVQQHQEALLTAAWEQAGDARAGNQRLRQMELAAAVGDVLHRKHLGMLNEEEMTRFAAPGFGKLHASDGSLRDRQAASRLPLAANGFAMRRLGRLRGPLSRRVASNGGEQRTSARSWVASLNNTADPIAQPRPAPPPREIWAFADLPVNNLPADSLYGVFRVFEEGVDIARPDTPVLINGRTERPDHFRSAAQALLARALPLRSSRAVSAAPSLARVREVVMEQMQPSAAMATVAGAALAVGIGARRVASAQAAATGLETLLANPRFEQPMSEVLMELHPDCLLPGIERVGPDAVVGLRTNSRFVDAFMVGLNHEMGRELLWRGFPSDPRCTAFANFWPASLEAALPDLHTWGHEPLGHADAGAFSGAFVMLLRSSLLRKYPNALVYLVPAVVGPVAGPRAPDLSRPMQPVLAGRALADISYFGFAVSPAFASGADGGAGCFVVIEEQLSAPRFGVETSTDVVPGAHLSLQGAPPGGLELKGRTWARNSAHMAGITRQTPVRLAIHASALV
jgi:hypothetical protein